MLTAKSGRATFNILEGSSASFSVEATYRDQTQSVILADSRWQFIFPALKPEHLVLLIHGINTRGDWIAEVSESLQAAGLIVEPAGYGVYGVTRFLMPFSFLRKRAVDRVRIRINAAISLHRPAKISVVAHSFGTYIFSQLLASEFQIKWHRIIFCGSVVSSDFPFHQYQSDRFSPPILNEIGTRDAWPAVAAAVTWGYGSIGSHGYQGAPLKERWHRKFAHSDFLTSNFAAKFWVPFLLYDRIVKADNPEPFPLWIAILTRLPIKYLVWGFVLLPIVLTLR